jgi:hypothetical protein
MKRIFIVSIFFALASSAHAQVFSNPQVSVDGSAYFASSTVLGQTSNIFARLTVQDSADGLYTNLASARFSTDGGLIWAVASLSVSLVPGGSASTDPFYLVASGLNLADSLTLNLIEFTAYDLAGVGASSRFGIQTHLNVAAIPEPEIYAMMLAGLGLLGYVTRRKKLQAAALLMR